MTVQPPIARRRVVVGVDGSPHSERALEWAAFLARCLGSDLEVVIAWAPLAQWGLAWIPRGPDWDPAGDATKMLELSLQRVFGDAIPSSVHRRVVESGAARALIDASRDADALVVGSRGHGGFAELLLGSVGAACAAHAVCPVVVVHGDRSPGDADPVERIEPATASTR